MKLSAINAAAFLLILPGLTPAATYYYAGDTTGKPTYNRAVEDFSGLSPFGQGVNFDSLPFSVSASGNYDFSSMAKGGWDNFIALYSPSFIPESALSHGLIANDDSSSTGVSAFSIALTAAIPYVLVTTGFEGGLDFGAYTNSITGPGNIIPVPELGRHLLMALGLVVVGMAARRRRAARLEPSPDGVFRIRG